MKTFYNINIDLEKWKILNLQHKSVLKYMDNEDIIGDFGQPQENGIVETNELQVVGWCYSTLGNIVSIQIFIDEKKVHETENGIERKDVFKKNPVTFAINSGFNTKIKLDSMNDGIHQLKIIAKSNNIEKLIGNVVKFQLIRDKIFGDIIMPYDRETIKSNDLKVKGWSFSTTSKDVLVSINIDSKKVAELIPSLKMSDVGRHFSNWKTSTKSGFFITVDLTKFNEGNHILKVNSNTKDKELLLGTINFELKRN